jgi:hypothetical protein
MMATDWKRGALYTRSEIHRELGGGTQEFLPHVDGEIVCGCFTPDLNPDAPNEILPGNGPGIVRWATRFYEQRSPVPVFLKRDTNQWEYVGNWIAERLITDRSEIAKRQQRTSRTDISMILRLAEV